MLRLLPPTELRRGILRDMSVAPPSADRRRVCVKLRGLFSTTAFVGIAKPRAERRFCIAEVQVATYFTLLPVDEAGPSKKVEEASLLLLSDAVVYSEQNEAWQLLEPRGSKLFLWGWRRERVERSFIEGDCIIRLISIVFSFAVSPGFV